MIRNAYANCHSSKTGRIISNWGSEEVPLQLGHEGQVKCRYGDMAEDIVDRENAANRMALRWWAGSQML